MHITSLSVGLSNKGENITRNKLLLGYFSAFYFFSLVKSPTFSTIFTHNYPLLNLCYFKKCFPKIIPSKLLVISKHNLKLQVKLDFKIILPLQL